MNARLRALPAAVLAIVAIAAGCGDDDSDTTTSAAGDRPAAAEERSKPSAVEKSGSSKTTEPSDSKSDSSGKSSAPSDDKSKTTPADRPDGSTVTASSLGKSAFLKRANAICREADVRLLGEQEAYVEKHSAEELPPAALLTSIAKEVMLPAIEAEIAAIRKLGAPAGDARQVEAMLASAQAAVAEVRGLEQVATSKAFETPFARASQELRAYGLSVCADFVP